MTETKTVALGDILSKQQLKDIAKLLNETPEHNQVEFLKNYLNTFPEELEAKGVLPDFLAYMLYAKHNHII